MRQIVLLVGLVISLHQIKACSCSTTNSTFLTSIAEFTAEVKVVQIDTLSNSNDPYWSPILTRLKVVRIFNSSAKVEYVWMRNASGTDCERGLFPDSIGQKYIITGQLFDIDYYQKRVENATNIPLLQATTCGVTILHIKDGYVYGEITVNKRAQIQSKYNELLLENESQAKAYIKNVYSSAYHPDRVQSIKLEDFYQLLKPTQLE